MREHQGYFALVQYSEYPERAEFVNIGVVLFAHHEPHVFCKFVDRPNRIERVFRSSPGAYFHDLKEALKGRLASEFSGGWDPRAVDAFIEMRSGKVRLSSARSVYVHGSAEAVLSKLFDDLVGDLPQHQYGKRASTRLKEQFRLKGVEQLLDKPAPILLPSGVEVKAPHGYQNGSYNLIRAVALDGAPDQALGKASPHMIEGRLLSEATSLEKKKKLIVVGDIGGQEDGFVKMVARQMEEHDVGFFTLDNIDPLIADIRANVTGK